MYADYFMASWICLEALYLKYFYLIQYELLFGAIQRSWVYKAVEVGLAVEEEMGTICQSSCL